MKKRLTQNKNSGFLILYSILIAVVILTIVVGITNTAYKEAILSNAARNSQQAFFSSDTGLECALFLDRVADAFPPTAIIFADNDCGDLNPDYTIIEDNYYAFTLDIGESGCAKVTVDKLVVPDEDTPDITITEIVSKGYNVSCDDTDEAGALVRVTERQLEARYQNFVAAPLPEAEAGGEAL